MRSSFRRSGQRRHLAGEAPLEQGLSLLLLLDTLHIDLGFGHRCLFSNSDGRTGRAPDGGILHEEQEWVKLGGSGVGWELGATVDTSWLMK